MRFIIADTFRDSLSRLDAQSQALVKQTAHDFQMNPALPSLQFHKLDKAKDKRFWSARANDDIRIIVSPPTRIRSTCTGINGSRVSPPLGAARLDRKLAMRSGAV